MRAFTDTDLGESECAEPRCQLHMASWIYRLEAQ